MCKYSLGATDKHLTELVNHIKDTFGKQEHVHIDLDIVTMEIEADKAVAIGLIVNELLTNVFKYSFRQSQGKVSLRLFCPTAQEVVLTLYDDAPAWTPVPAGQQPSFGLKIVNLMARQLDARLEQERPGYTTYRLTLKR